MVDTIFTPEQLAEIHRYHWPKYVWTVGGTLVMLLRSYLILRFAITPLYRLAERAAAFGDRHLGLLRTLPVTRVVPRAMQLMWKEPGWGTALLFAFFSYLLGELLDLPESFYWYHHERAFGLATNSYGQFLWDVAKGSMVIALAISFIAFGLFGLARWVKRWWLVLGIAVVLLGAISSAIDPYRARLYYAQKPLPDGEVRTQITALMAKAGIDFRDVLVEETLGTTVKLQAYFAGRGPTRTIVLNDSLLKNLSTDEIVAAVAHEAGHVNESRVLGAIGSSVAMLVFLFLVEQLLQAVARRRWWGIDPAQPHDVRALPLVFVVFALVTLVVGPVSGAFSRQRELDADQYGLKLTGNPEAFERMLVKAARVNKMDPDPPAWVVWQGRSHPTIRQRLEAVERSN